MDMAAFSEKDFTSQEAEIPTRFLLANGHNISIWTLLEYGYFICLEVAVSSLSRPTFGFPKTTRTTLMTCAVLSKWDAWKDMTELSKKNLKYRSDGRRRHHEDITHFRIFSLERSHHHCLGACPEKTIQKILWPLVFHKSQLNQLYGLSVMKILIFNRMLRSGTIDIKAISIAPVSTLHPSLRSGAQKSMSNIWWSSSLPKA